MFSSQEWIFPIADNNYMYFCSLCLQFFVLATTAARKARLLLLVEKKGGKGGDFTPIPKQEKDVNGLIENDAALDNDSDLEAGWAA